jgi:hypothetical protein
MGCQIIRVNVTAIVEQRDQNAPIHQRQIQPSLSSTVCPPRIHSATRPTKHLNLPSLAHRIKISILHAEKQGTLTSHLPFAHPRFTSGICTR